MTSVRQKARELIGTVPEQRIVACGYVPLKIARTTWMYVRPESPHNPLYRAPVQAERLVSDRTETTVQEPTVDGLDDLGGQQKWTA